jgi:hypothetical protein
MVVECSHSVFDLEWLLKIYAKGAMPDFRQGLPFFEHYKNKGKILQLKYGAQSQQTCKKERQAYQNLQKVKSYGKEGGQDQDDGNDNKTYKKSHQKIRRKASGNSHRANYDDSRSFSCGY